MEKFASQQAALRTALNIVLKAEPVKGQLVITDEQRVEVGNLMMMWYKEGAWSIKPGTRAAENPLQYVIGKRPTDLIQAWVVVKKKDPVVASGSTNKLELLKQAVAAGLMTQEQAQAEVLKLLAA